MTGPDATAVCPATLRLRLALDVFDTSSDRIFCDFIREMMDSNASSDKEYGPMELDQMIQDEFFDSSDLNEEVDIIMLMSMQEEMDRQVEHILNFKGSRGVINRDRVSEAKLVHWDYFSPSNLL